MHSDQYSSSIAPAVVDIQAASVALVDSPAVVVDFADIPLSPTRTTSTIVDEFGLDDDEFSDDDGPMRPLHTGI